MFTGEIRRARSKRPLVIGVVFLLVVASILLLVPMPHPVETTFTLQPAGSVDVIAPRAGTVAEVLMVDGSMVAKGTVLAKFDVSEAQAALPDAEKKVEQLEQRKASGGKVSPAAKAAVAKAEKDLAKLNAALARVTKAAKGQETPAVSAAQKKADAAALKLEKARAAAGPTGAELEAALTAAQETVATLKAQLASASLVSPGSGLLVMTLEKGAVLSADQKLGVVQDTAKLRAELKVPGGEKTTRGMAAELTLGASKRRVTLSDEARGDVVTAEVDNAKGELKPGTTGAAVIEGEQRSLLSGVF